MRYYAILFIVISTMCVLINIRSNYHRHESAKPIYKHTVKLILIWTQFWPKFNASHEFGCNGSCIVTWDKSKLDQASAVVFNLCFTGHVPDHKPAGQLWVMDEWEPPTECNLPLTAERHAATFDLTVSYRRDSDIWRPYGLIGHESSSNVTDSTAWLPRVPLSKRKMAVAWLVSHCGTSSKREILASLLSKHIKVDKYGGCGPLKCPRSSNIDCLRMIEKNYAFYFAAENALCEDYVTEKLFNLIKYDVQVIPIVYGGADYSSFLPSNSYIDANSFPTVTQLGAYLNHVASNETLFNSYLASRKDYTVVEPRIGCQLCSAINHFKEKSASAINIHHWFIRDKCYDKHIKFE
ncbi:Alpha-(1,3)-fucosyltransferase C [Halotydeus destructor]|nr:Alpha-(1,3)-fucosyltransferase C [Halotydeus destructor]